jgi:DNA excision repair protein ERCC-2
LGLPQINAVNEELQRRMQTQFGSGYEYTYLYPGIQKVVQAAGRVIRTATDRGVLYLIDDRYTDPQVRRLLPQWWNIDATQPTQPSSAAARPLSAPAAARSGHTPRVHPGATVSNPTTTPAGG